MRLFQNQLWRQGDADYRIVHLERLSVDYKKLDVLHPEGGTHHTATKKAFCRLIKGAREISDEPHRADDGIGSPPARLPEQLQQPLTDTPPAINLQPPAADQAG